ncbi:MAG TPA: alpha-amylase family protein [Cyclobacteriaceae bacterium]|nr:alpha-amylase family protein [Cyclobacteriaceae bacterium]
MKSPLLFVIILLPFLFTSCTSTKEKIPSVSTLQPPGKMIIYQLLPRLFGNKDTLNTKYGSLEENGVGKFNDITDAALNSLQELGITHVWYTGVLEHASLTDYPQAGIPADDPDVVKGRAGSPYAIRDYYDVDPDLAVNVPDRMMEFEALISRTHAAGLKVIIDFVPNHVARAYHSDAKPAGVKDLGEDDDNTVAFSPGNNFYYLPGTAFVPPPRHRAPGRADEFPMKDNRFEEIPAKATGNNQFRADPLVTDWFETVKLNYGVDIQGGGSTHFDPVPDTWLKMKDILIFWTQKQVDGFRCDMAEMVPVEFWSWVIPQVKDLNPDVTFIAEIYNPDQYRNYIEAGKFDFLYDKVLLYDSLRNLVQGQGSTTAIHAIQTRLKGINPQMLHFMENHDEQRMASPFFAGDIWKGAPAMVLSATIDRGPVMIYSGQEVGEPGAGDEGFSGEDGRTTIYDYWGVPEHQKWMNGGRFDGAGLSMEQKQLRMFYGDLLNLVGKNSAFTTGDYFDITSFNVDRGNITDQMHAFLRVSADEKMLVINGFNSQEQDVRVQIPPDVAGQIGFREGTAYIARDLIWREVEVGFDENWSFELKMKPYSCFILKIK